MNETQLTYQAEWDVRDMLKLSRAHVHGTVLVLPQERNFATIESIQAYVDKVLALNFIRDRYPTAVRPLKVIKRPSNTSDHATCGGGVMTVPINTVNRWALREIVILHEMAHHLTPGTSHGQAFRTCFAWLVEEIIGPEAALLLRTEFWNRGLAVQ